VTECLTENGVPQLTETLPTTVLGLSEIIETLFLTKNPISGILDVLPTGKNGRAVTPWPPF